MNTSSSRRLFALLSACLLVALALPSGAESTPQESWLGLYFQGRKIGYTHLRTEKTRFRGAAALKAVSMSRADVEMLGNKVSQDTVTVTYADTSYHPLYQVYRITSNGSLVTIKADYKPGKIVCVVNSGGGPTTKMVSVPRGARLAGDETSLIQGQKIAVGQKTTLYYLNPLTITLDKSDIEVSVKEEVTLGGKSYEAFRITATSPFGNLTSWETSSGEMLKGEMPLGMAMFKEPKAAALNLHSSMPTFIVKGATEETKTAYVPPADFAIATAISTDKPIDNPRTAHALSLTVTGVEDGTLMLSDKRQQAAAVDGQTNTYSLHVQAEKFAPARSVTLPIKEPSVQAYLRRAPYLETDDPWIRRTAKALRGKETNAYRVVRRIQQWVYANMKPDYTIGVPRSCSDIFKRRRGVCRDYATLFAGLARAAGIPTRVVGGIVYGNGKFFYHAWAESWVGEWVAFDPTMNADFVDATHIKFSQGDVMDMFKIAGVIGRIKVHVESVE